jgi:polyisoprenoid-binding protein YceI
VFLSPGMKTMVLIFVAGILLWGGCTQAPQAPQAQTEEAKQVQGGGEGKIYTFLADDKEASKIIAIGTKVTGRHEIRFPIKEATATLTDQCISGGKIVLDIANLEVLDLQGEWKAELEGHLKSPDFFEADKYPEGIFEVTGCERGSGDTLYLSGNLTLRGVTKNIRFPLVYKYDPNQPTLEASFNINRQEWGISYKGKADDLIRDEVNIQVKLVGRAAGA